VLAFFVHATKTMKCSSLALIGACFLATNGIAQNASVARGEYIVRNAAVCGGCHAAGQDPDGPLSGGREFRDWRIGVARAANLTPDPETGLGTWSEADIVRALRTGVRKDGRLLAPVMPYAWFNEMSDDDALAVARYLKSLPPVGNAVRQNPDLAFKFAKLFMLHPLPDRSIQAPPAGPTPQYGAYIAQHVARCAECHTPLTGIRAQADKSRMFAGSDKPPKDFPAKPANLTPDNDTGIGRWSEADFLRSIREGIDPPTGRKLHPFMPSAQIRRMSEDDLRAIYLYLRTLPPISDRVTQ
jgi:mono/diheme cytochrome c family protein